MRQVYKNPNELASRLRDLVESYFDDLIDQDKLEESVKTIISANEDRVYKNGFMPARIANAIGRERVDVIDNIYKKMK
ncbi:TIGR04540 family protein [Clostridium tyrobutyricum]|uniref:TIGR04540 family protein n=1 Tax=Clostridium tyrobutyricum TaxID=1519 RepID=UPI0002D9AD8D|nr:TIGR04540 family protein [Clostridium tyrobutyricum]MBR9648397.1 TIGR04540 family protein [Clostridium tyrobutyricum]MBV4421261.1 TIGR04540 family protein [Clostridium tyrobutyricum]MBV4426322.1 TIGR04540 family protein [Clostridium tyrobutyricum]MBV4427426.1 TIGR04540 family protein [Clostridium tyrobutyricum]MBV4432365.1 TIGR04540 family protein [Clostridium tyrobutyricum]